MTTGSKRQKRGNMKICEFSIDFSKESIYQAIDCKPGNPVYEQVEREYVPLSEMAASKLRPCAHLAFGQIPAYAAGKEAPEGTKVLYVLSTLGGEISQWSTSLFAQGNYLAGMLVDAMADDYLFQMEEEVEETIILMCKEKGFGIEKRLEAPNGIGMEVQKAAWETVQACEETQIRIKESLMYEPLKTVCQVYVLQEGSKKYNTAHNCRECPAVSCKRRKVQPVSVSVIDTESGRRTNIFCEEGQTIQQALTQHGIYNSAVCGGRGTCGKCRIKVIAGKVPASEADKKYFKQAEWESGWRLACTAYPLTDCEIVTDREQEETFRAVTDFALEQSGQKEAVWGQEDRVIAPKWAIGIDLGTTTIAMQLVDLTGGQIVDTWTGINRQRAYGADVISRILASNQGKQKELKACVIKDLKTGICALTGKQGMEREEFPVSIIGIAGNTTLLHLLLGYSCKTLGVYPFTPVCIDEIRLDWTELDPESGWKIPVVILPGISTYVGADIAAGILACKMEDTEEISLLLDLGTNGEMALGNSKKILTASVAAGPAFEGGNITCGMGSVSGAISNVRIQNQKAQVRVIGEKSPVGICGTGVIETVYELLKEGIIDESGLMEEPFFTSGYVLAESADKVQIMLTQKDIRELQLAKAAVRAGIETLLFRYGIGYSEVKHIYVAGGFGYEMDFNKAMGIGLIPAAFAGRITAVGNSCLKGVLQYLASEAVTDRLTHIIAHAGEISLADDGKFQEMYMEHMYFKETV